MQNHVHPVLIDGAWKPARFTETFTATNPRTRQALSETYPISQWADIDAALSAAESAAFALRNDQSLIERIPAFLEGYAAALDAAKEKLASAASEETALPVTPRLAGVELPRTINQLRLAAAAAREGSWQRPTIDTTAGLRSCLAPIGPVWVIGPNNFPFAYNGISGGDFASAIAAGNPVIAKAHPLHPTTSRLLAEIAQSAASAAGLPAGTVQMLYHMSNDDGLKLIRDPRLAAVGFTGSRAAGLKLKDAADSAGKLFFGEMSSINPTVILPGALAENKDAIADQLNTSLLSGTGQFCTKPGLILLIAGAETEAFLTAVAAKISTAPAGVLFSQSGETSLKGALATLQSAGAEVIAGSAAKTAEGFGIPNTLLRTSAQKFLTNPAAFQTEAFGNAGLMVVADDLKQLVAVIRTLEGNLTGSVYSSSAGQDEVEYTAVAAALRPKVGRFLNDKMPTGVAVSSAMNHGGPYPATSQPHFSAVGFPGAMLRFTQLESYDNVREARLPVCLRNKNPNPEMWRMIDGSWTKDDV